jgi:signal transduction histidine kinase
MDREDARLIRHLESENRRLRLEMTQRLRATNALIEVGQNIVSTLDMDDLLALIVDEALKAVPKASKGSIHLLEGRVLVPKVISEYTPDGQGPFQMRVRGGLSGIGGTRFLGGPNPSAHLRVGEGIAGAAAQEKKAIYVPNVDDDPRYVPSSAGDVRSLLAIPLLIEDDQVLGTLSLESLQESGFTRSDQRLLATFANQAAIAIRNAQMTERLRISRDRLSQRTAELEEIRATLEERVERRTEDLMEANQALEEKIRELHEAQQQLVQSEKMASLGVLSAGIAHEINNPIGFIQSNLGMLQTSVSDLLTILGHYRRFREMVSRQGILAEKVQELESLEQRLDLDFLNADLPQLIADAREGTQRVKSILDGLRAFSRASDTVSPEPFGVNREIDMALRIAWNEIKYVAEVEKSYGEIPPVIGIAPELNQVLVNLLVNAAQAIAQRNDGSIGKIQVRTYANGGSVRIEVADNGVGIPEENLPRIFDPFFTTKKVGQGTGLGLSVSYGIIKRMGGQIDVRSQVGRGTRFRITLPAASPQRRPASLFGRIAR